MAFQYFQIPADSGESVQAELNAFLAGKKVTRREQHLSPQSILHGTRLWKPFNITTVEFRKTIPAVLKRYECSSPGAD